MIWRDRWIQVWIVTSKYAGGKAKKYLVGNVKNKTKNAIMADIKVDIDWSLTGVAANANVVIGGYHSRTLFLLASELAKYIENLHIAYIEINAGYSNNHGVIFRGSIMEAVPNMDTADFKISLKCIGLANVDNGTPISVSMNGRVDARAAVRQIAEENGFRFRDLSSGLIDYHLDTGLSGANMSLSQFFTFLTYNNRKFGVSFEQGDVIDIGGKMSKGTITFFDANTLTLIDGMPERKIKKIGTNQLVGTPTINTLGAVLKIRFRPDIMGLDAVKIISSRYPQMKNFIFIVQQIKTHLDTKGNNWYKELYVCYPNTGLVGNPKIYGENTIEGIAQ